ncbi:MAG: translation initiation factor IF-2 [Clostridia bacterium]|nr:translation initiation factor IF-2 [Clostridia bacterium]
MARIKDFAKDFNLDMKDALELIERAGLGARQSGANIEADEISTVLNILTLENQCKGINDYLDGKITIGSGKKKAKKAEPKTEEPKAEPKKEEPKKVETKVEPKKEEPKAEPKVEPKKEEPKAEPKVEPKVEPKKEEPKAEPKVEPKAEPKKEEPKAEPKVEPKKEEPKKVEPKVEPKKEEPKKEDGKSQFNKGDRFGGKPQFEKKEWNKDKPFNKEGRGGFDKDKGAGYEKKEWNKDKPFNKEGRGSFDKDRAEKKTYNVTPKPKRPESNVIEIKTKTGETKVVDTRISDVDLSKYDEKFDSYAASHESYGKGGKQKLKKQNNRDNYSSKKEKERAAMEKMKKAAFEKAKNTQLSITVPDEITVGELASRLKVNSGEIIKKLMLMGVMASVNEVVDYDTAYLIGDELGAKVTKEVVVTIEEKLFEEEADAEDSLVERAPVVCVMGHVDHGKTSLLDAIRHTHVTTGEAGGITQHIGAYSVNINGKDITFLDTPGHEAFTAMRLRGAMATDIAIIVVAADDGIMPQTVEAINHAKAAGVDIVVAINKMDKPTANPDNIKQELTKYDLVPEEWGGDIMCIPVSAHTKMGIDDLLESVLLIAEVKELKANPQRLAKGIVIEAKLDKGRGPVATILVQNGTLKSGDVVIAGTAVGRVRAMTDHTGRAQKLAGPSVPVEITGLSEVPNAGDEFNAVKDERMARELAEQRKAKAKEEIFKANAKVNLDDLFSQINDGVKELNIIVKADVGGSCEAVKASLVKLSNAEVKVNVIHTAAGGITESDVMLAAASNAIIVGFNVRPDKNAIDSAERQNVDIRTHRIIYEIIEEIEAAMKGMLAPTFKEVIYGHAEVRQTIRVPNVGTIAGSYVQDGKIVRSASIRIIRDGIVIAEDKIASLKRFKDDAKEVNAGYECGVGLDKFNDIKEGDIMEAFGMEEVEK